MFFNLRKKNLINFIDTIARVFISSIFINALPTMIFDFSYYSRYINSTGINELLSPFLLFSSITLIIIGIFLFIFRKASNLGPIILLVFLIPTTFIIHVFAFPDIGAIIRNLSIIGVLIITILRD
ncbi:DoxX family membrane protein [Prochlorococcus marinus XMU1402]|uniref:DoxX family membrane protein n=1 Tax=Prochlorococcus marinus TaxID=1219 RepID=UPI001AD96386|nr:DoxX family membrane protein [Prochlorococcus marinus]MBO8232385.1 DoxX family membrane protein [Prochlorococcus marinus XMU1402]